MENSVIQTINLSKSFQGVQALNDLSVSFPRGKATGLIGPNGSGKTTLMNVMTGLLKPDAGTIKIGERTFERIHPYQLRRLRIARTFQDGRLIEQMSVQDNLLLAIAKTGLWGGFKERNIAHHQKRLHDVLVATGLIDYRHVNAEKLSYGWRKLLELSRAVIQDADIYFFDEPFTGLFPEVREKVAETLINLKKSGKSIVVIEHEMGVISKICDYTIVLDSGKLLAHGAPESVLNNRHVQEAYLGK